MKDLRTKDIYLEFETPPVSVNKMYRGRRFLTQEGKDAKEGFTIEAMRQYKYRPVKGDVRIIVYFCVPNRRSDLDNLLKGFLDSMSGIVWEDDRQIVEIKAVKIISKDKRESKIQLHVL